MGGSVFHHILVPIDGSPASEAAVAVALRLAGGGGDIVFAHAINRVAIIAECTTPYGGDASVALGALEGDEGDLFTRVIRQAAAAGISATSLALDGVSYEQIARAAREQQVDAVVIGTRGRGGIGRLVLGSTAEGVLRRSAVPTIVVRDGARAGAGPLRCILAAVDESDAARGAATVAVDLAARDGGRVVFVQVAQSPDAGAAAVALNAAQAYADERDVRYDTAMVHDDAAAHAILISADVCHADAIALGTHGRQALARLVLGSVAEAVIRASTVPVIVVPSAPAVRARTAKGELLPRARLVGA